MWDFARALESMQASWVFEFLGLVVRDVFLHGFFFWLQASRFWGVRGSGVGSQLLHFRPCLSSGCSGS